MDNSSFKEGIKPISKRVCCDFLVIFVWACSPEGGEFAVVGSKGRKIPL